MESRDYETILNAMPEISVFVIREADCGLLYANRRGQEASAEVRLGVSCCELWTHVCGRCPLLCMGDRQEGKFVSYNEPFGGMVDITVARTLWVEDTPAFVITVSPREDDPCGPYQEILRVDLLGDRCDMLKSVPNSWQLEGEQLTQQLERFARSGAIYHLDVEPFLAFIQPDSLRSALREGRSLLYRRQGEGGYRWKQMGIIPEQKGCDQSALLCVRELRGVQPAVQAQELLERAMEDRSYIISSLSSLFFSTYYIDLEHDTFRTVTQLRRVKDVLGSEVNCTAALEIYANHFIHPEDREEYLSVMNVQNLRQRLRWWEPYVAVEYRRLSEDPEANPDAWEWVRATAVLARTGQDDMPITVVYAAQDITDSRRKA